MFNNRRLLYFFRHKYVFYMGVFEEHSKLMHRKYQQDISVSHKGRLWAFYLFGFLSPVVLALWERMKIVYIYLKYYIYLFFFLILIFHNY